MVKPTATLSKKDFDQIKRIITSRTGLVFPKSREAELRQCLLDGFNKSGTPTFEKYLKHLESDSLDREDIKLLIARLTVGETYFFRNKPQFELLSKVVIPQLIQNKARTAKVLRIWSAGCSTGEEAYSLAILLLETVPHISRWKIDILGTDISEESLRAAETGEYRQWSFREVDTRFKERYFTKTDDGYKINPEIREMVTFCYLNLIEDIYPLATNGTNFMDIILCRNVMIYFKPSLNKAITQRFYRSLNNEGYLITGHAESPDHIFQGFKKEMHPHTVVYVKKEKLAEWDTALKLRFRGSGFIPPNVVPYSAPVKPHELKKFEIPKERFRAEEETAIFEEGANAYKQRNFKSAKIKFHQVLEINPKNHRASYMLALIAADQAHLRKAEMYCLKAIEGYPLSLEAHYLLAVIARENGDRENELGYLKKVIYIDRGFILGHYQIGVYYQKQGNFVLARKFFRNAFELLDKWNENDYIEGTEGMTVGRLKDSIVRYLEEIDDENKPLIK